MSAFAVRIPGPRLRTFARRFSEAMRDPVHMETTQLDWEVFLMADVEAGTLLMSWPWYSRYLWGTDQRVRGRLHQLWQAAREETRAAAPPSLTMKQITDRFGTGDLPEDSGVVVADVVIMRKADLVATTATEFCAVLRACRARCSLSTTDIVTASNIPKSQVYALLDPRRKTLPTNKDDQIPTLLRTIGLPEQQIKFVMDQYFPIKRGKKGEAISAPGIAEPAPTDASDPSDTPEVANDLEDDDTAATLCSPEMQIEQRVITAVRRAIRDQPVAASSAQPQQFWFAFLVAVTGLLAMGVAVGGCLVVHDTTAKASFVVTALFMLVLVVPGTYVATVNYSSVALGPALRRAILVLCLAIALRSGQPRHGRPEHPKIIRGRT